MGRVMSQQLDRTKPLWEIWMVEGLERAAAGRSSRKVHHCMVDGVSGTELLTVVLDDEREPTLRSARRLAARAPAARRASSPPDALAERVAEPLRAAACARPSARRASAAGTAVEIAARAR